MSDTDYRQQHAMELQLTAIRMGGLYGALAFAGLIAAHLTLGQPYAALGALLAITGSLFAYLNFTVVTVNPESLWIGRTQLLSIGSGLLSGLLIVAGAL